MDADASAQLANDRLSGRPHKPMTCQPNWAISALGIPACRVTWGHLHMVEDGYDLAILQDFFSRTAKLTV
jgi:hypothetical protein